MNIPSSHILELELKSRLMVLKTIAAFVIIFIIWASLFHIDELVRAQGQVVPHDNIQSIQSLEGGILTELLVQEGSVVKQGDIVARIQDTDFASRENETFIRQKRLMIQQARLTAEANNQTPAWPNISEDVERETYAAILENEKQLYQSHQQELNNALSLLKTREESTKAEIAEANATINKLDKNIALTEQEAEITGNMVAQNAMPKIEEIKVERRLNELKGQKAETTERLSALNANLRLIAQEFEDAKDRFNSEVLQKLTDINTQLAQIDQEIRAVGDRVDRTALRSPINGVVNRIQMKSIGGVLRSGDVLMDIVPNDSEMKILAQVKPQDIAFLKIEQPVRITITAYDPARFGQLSGQVSRISASTIENNRQEHFFEVEVKTDKPYLGKADAPLPISAGMQARLDIITGKRSIMQYLLKPLRALKYGTFTEH